jgi:hypothetical protein
MEDSGASQVARRRGSPSGAPQRGRPALDARRQQWPTASGGEAQVPFGATETGWGRLTTLRRAPHGFEPECLKGVYAVRRRTVFGLADRPVEHTEGCADLSRVRRGPV